MQRARWLLGGIAASIVALAAFGVAESGSAPASQPVPRFEHVIVVVFENKDVDQVLGSSDAPTFNKLANRYATLVPYQASARPSLPNYIVMVAGSTGGITSNCDSGQTCVVDLPSIADSLEAKRMTWKTYAEGLPSPGYTGVTSGRYARKHNPLIFFRSIVTNPRRLKRIVPYTQLALDLKAQRLPDFSLVIPDMCNGMHDCSVATGDAWLKREIAPLLKRPALRRSVVFVVFDEDDAHEDPKGGRIPALALGPLVRPGSTTGTLMTHPRLLRTIEQAWGLPYLGESARAKPLTGIWKR